MEALTILRKYVTIWLHMENAFNSYHAISDDTRRQILDTLYAESLTAGAIAKRFRHISRPAVSRHLAVLRRARLVLVRKRGRERVYVLNAAPLKDIADWVGVYRSRWVR
jgi:DNA-binding transcriptional ArsR family regulator